MKGTANAAYAQTVLHWESVQGNGVVVNQKSEEVLVL
jgi:hypothetical protein